MTPQLLLKAKLPMLSFKTDDVAHVGALLKYYSGGDPVSKVLMTPGVSGVTAFFPKLGYTFSKEFATAEVYEKLLELGKTLIFINCDVPMAFKGGILPTPDGFLEEVLEGHKMPPGLLPAFRGLSIKAATELCRITLVTPGELTPSKVRKVRQEAQHLSGGLYPLDTDDGGFYRPHEQLVSWVEKSGKFFLSPQTKKELMPRGVLLDGPPGTGKTQAAKFLARSLGVPLYRLDLGTTMTRWLGEAEARLASFFDLLDQESPCVLLLDEAEKILPKDNKEEVAMRMLSQLLWWLQEHTSRVLVVMTTNNRAKLPEELYRPGRIDLVINIGLLPHPQALELGRAFLVHLMKPKQASLKLIQGFTLPTHKKDFSAVEVTSMVAQYLREYI